MPRPQCRRPPVQGHKPEEERDDDQVDDDGLVARGVEAEEQVEAVVGEDHCEEVAHEEALHQPHAKRRHELGRRQGPGLKGGVHGPLELHPEQEHARQQRGGELGCGLAEEQAETELPSGKEGQQQEAQLLLQVRSSTPEPREHARRNSPLVTARAITCATSARVPYHMPDPRPLRLVALKAKSTPRASPAGLLSLSSTPFNWGPSTWFCQGPGQGRSNSKAGLYVQKCLDEPLNSFVPPGPLAYLRDWGGGVIVQLGCDTSSLSSLPKPTFRLESKHNSSPYLSCRPGSNHGWSKTGVIPAAIRTTKSRDRVAPGPQASVSLHSRTRRAWETQSEASTNRNGL